MAVDAGTLARVSTELWSPDDLRADPAAGFVAHGALGAGGGLLLLPLSERRAAADAMLRWTDVTPVRESAVRLAAWAALRCGLAQPALRSRLAIRTVGDGATSATTTGNEPTGSPSLHEYLAEAVGAPTVHLSCAFGTMRPNRKPIVRIHATDGSTLGFAKIGWNPLTEALVGLEADLLQSAAVDGLEQIRVPRVLHRGRWRDRAVCVTSPLVGRPAWRRPAAPGAEILLDVLRLGEITTSSLAEGPYRPTLERRLEAMTTDDRDAVADALARIDARFAAVSLRHGWWHGDWTPWNMRETAGRRSVWDWERSGPAVPVGFDAIHYEFHGRLARSTGRTAVDTLVAAVDAARPTLARLGQTEVEAVAALYAVEMRLRFDAPTSVGWLPGLVEGAVGRFITRP